ncbi:MAG: glycosidase, partial [Fibrella sp.]|nr:glycosidase [Armatimonadota bacterium]
RKVNGVYAMISRQDGENIYIMFSEQLHFWYSKQVLLKPTYPWEFVQLGNCGSPIETDAGWLLFTHGVGPMRKYCIGAALLDINDPTKVIGRTKEPILTPNANEREGYVPNVVYSCGALVHNGTVVLPYAMSDYASSFALIPLNELLASMQ